MGSLRDDPPRDPIYHFGVLGGQHNERTDRKAGEQPEEGRAVRLPGHHGHRPHHASHVVSGLAVGERDVHPLVLPPAGALGDRGRLQALRGLRRTVHRGQRDARARNRPGPSLLLRLLLRPGLVGHPGGVGPATDSPCRLFYGLLLYMGASLFISDGLFPGIRLIFMDRNLYIDDYRKRVLLSPLLHFSCLCEESISIPSSRSCSLSFYSLSNRPLILRCCSHSDSWLSFMLESRILIHSPQL